MSPRIKKKPGAQPGNQNARKHGFYSRYLTLEQRRSNDSACQVNGICAELALLRCKLAEMLENDPSNVGLVNRLINTVNRLEAARPPDEGENRISAVSGEVFGGFIAMGLARGDKDIVKKFDEWMQGHYGGGV